MFPAQFPLLFPFPFPGPVPGRGPEGQVTLFLVSFPFPVSYRARLDIHLPS